jgi:hypothetical protein
MLSDPQTTPGKSPAKPSFTLAFLANRYVASSSTPSLYYIYSSVRVSLAPCASLKFVARLCVQAVISAGEVLGKLANFCAISTARFLCALSRVGFVHSFHTTYAQIWRGCAHKLSFLSPPCSFGFYSFPTGPTNTTNLIKE